MKLLIVEDSQVLTNKLVEILNEIPDLDIVGSARNAAEVARLVPLLHPDALIVDLQIDGGSGLDVLRATKEGLENPLVIILTNSVSPFVRQACLKAGADYFLDKSYDLGQLLAILSAASKTKRPARLMPGIGAGTASRRKTNA